MGAQGSVQDSQGILIQGLSIAHGRGERRPFSPVFGELISKCLTPSAPDSCIHEREKPTLEIRRTTRLLRYQPLTI